MISTKKVSKFYGSTQVLNDITFEIAQGEIVGFLGPNGAGKTTLMRILTTYLPLTSGKVIIADWDISQNSFAARQNLGYLPENPPLYLDMTVKDYLKFAGKLKNIPSRPLATRIDQVLEECALHDVKNTPIDNLSKGYKQRVGIAQAIIHNPKVLILDEPTNGLDPQQILQVRKLIKGLEHKRTVILSTHILSEIEQIAQRVLIINKGKIVTDNSLNNLLKGSQNLEDIFLNLTNDNPVNIAQENSSLRSPQLSLITQLREEAGTVPTSSNGSSRSVGASYLLCCVGKEFLAVRKVLLSYTVKNTLSIALKELSGYFKSPKAYIVLMVAISVFNVFFFMIIEQNREATLRDIFKLMEFMFVFIIPILTMEIFAEEKRSGTIEFLLTSPVSSTAIVLGKYLGSLGFVSILIAFTAVYYGILEYFGSPDRLAILTGYIGIYLEGAFFVAIGILTSSWTKNQIIAAITSYMIIFSLYCSITFANQLEEGGAAVEILKHLSVWNHSERFFTGLLDISSLVYFLSGIGLCLFLTRINIENRS